MTDESKPGEFMPDWVMALARDSEQPLHPDLVPYLSSPEVDGSVFPMVRHPLIYDLLPIHGRTNRIYLEKHAALIEAVVEQDWHTVVWLHERPYRFTALVEYITGRDDLTGDVLPLDTDASQDVLDLVAEVWIDSENIEQHTEDWRALLDRFTGFLGTATERAAFDALPWAKCPDWCEQPGGSMMAWRGGTVGDWSWTTDYSVAEFFARRSGYEPRGLVVHKSECFGYFTRRSESELMVRLTPERAPLVYPGGMP